MVPLRILQHFRRAVRRKIDRVISGQSMLCIDVAARQVDGEIVREIGAKPGGVGPVVIVVIIPLYARGK